MPMVRHRKSNVNVTGGSSRYPSALSTQLGGQRDLRGLFSSLGAWTGVSSVSIPSRAARGM